MRSRCILGVVVTLARVVPSISSAQVPSGEPYDFLRTEIGYTENELRAIADRKAVTKVVETPEPVKWQSRASCISARR